MPDSILNTTKKALGFDANYTAFDPDIIMHINATIPTLNQLGIGIEDGFMITDASAEWSDLIGTDKNLNGVKNYVYMKVRLLFDPPQTSFHLNALQEQIKETEWRLNVYREGKVYPLPEELPIVIDGGDPDGGD